MQGVQALPLRPRRAAAAFGLALVLTGLVPVAGLPVVAAATPTLRPETLTVGANHACALDAAGKAWCWGSDSAGQLGNGATTGNQVSPVAVDTTAALPDTYSALSAGGNTTCGLSGGVAYCWGDDASGQLGDGATTTGSAVPSPVDTLAGLVTSVASISVGSAHACAIVTTTDVNQDPVVVTSNVGYCWGSDSAGQLGDGATSTGSAVPSPVDGGLSLDDISAGGASTCAITLGGVAWCWGSDSDDQLGNGPTNSDQNAPVEVSTLSGLITSVASISVGAAHACAIVTTTDVAPDPDVVTPNLAYCWGDDASGQVGDGSPKTDRNSPTAVDTSDESSPPLTRPDTYLQIEAGAAHTCAVEAANGQVWCWGEDGDRQVGNGNGTSDEPSPDRAGSLVDIGWVAAGGASSCAIKDSGSGPGVAWCWGSDTSGQLGNSVATTGAQGAPSQVGTDFTVHKWGSGTGTLAVTSLALTCATACTSARATAPWNTSVPSVTATADGGSVFAGWAGGGCSGKVSPCTPTPWPPAGPTADVYGAFTKPTVDRIAAGESQSCALTTSGTPSCWGTDTDGELGNGATTGDQSSPSAVSPTLTLAGIATGKNHSCGVTTTSTLFCWGSDDAWQIGDGDEGQPGTPVGDGPETSPAQESTAATDWLQVATGALHTCALKTAGTAFCWGSNAVGQVGNGTLDSQPAPVAVTGGLAFTRIAAGDQTTCAVADSGVAYCWGSDANGRLGNGDTNVDVSAPSAVVVPTALATLGAGFLDVAAGAAHACAIALDGTAWCWGSDSSGQLGNGATSTDQSTPVAVTMPGGRTFARIAAGGNTSCALADDGAVYCWGSNTDGQVGDASTTDRNVPTLVVAPGVVFTGVSVGSLHTCGSTSTLMYCWGSDGNGRLGNGAALSAGQSSPSLVGASLRIAKAGAGSGTVTADLGGGPSTLCDATCSTANAVSPFNGTLTLASSSTDTFEGWFGLGCTGTSTCSPAPSGADPVVVASYSNGTEVRLSAGVSHGCAVSGSGASRLTWCWGDQTDGRLGNGQSSGLREFPALVTGGGVFTEVATGVLGGSANSFSCAVMREGTAWCWGYGLQGQLGNGGTASASAPVPVTMPASKTFSRIAAGAAHACALAYDGTAWCWGSDANGQLGNGATTTTDQSTPVAVTMPGGRTFTRITAGASHTCALADNGVVYCWGSDVKGQLGDGAATTGSTTPSAVTGTFASVSAGQNHTCALTSGGVASCWGDDTDGQLGSSVANDGCPVSAVNTCSSVPRAVDTAGSLPDTYASISAGRAHTCGIAAGAAYCWGAGSFGRLGTGSEASSIAPAPVVVPTGVASFSAIAAGNLQTCAIAVDGIADGLATAGPWCWGYDVNGQLGNSTTLTLNQSAPTQVGADLILSKSGFGTGTVTSSPDGLNCGAACLTARMTVPFGTEPPLAITLTSDTATDGWTGCTSSTATTCSLTISTSHPVTVTYAGSAPAVVPLKIAAGDLHACAVNKGGLAGCWGRGAEGQLGDGTTTTAQQVTSAVTMPAGRTFVEVSAGGANSCALADNGRAYCWGADGSGQLGDDAPLVAKTTPTLVATVTTFSQISVSSGAAASGAAHACGLTVSGAVYCWGSDLYGQLGNGALTTANQATPALVPLPVGVSAFARVSAGLNHTCAITSAGAAYCWGRDQYGQLGDGGTNVNQPSPVLVAGGLQFREISAGSFTTCGVTTSGAGYCWGSDANGRLGNGAVLVADQGSPSAVAGGLTFSQVSAGGAHACGVAADRVYCWGSDQNGQLGDGGAIPGADQSSPVQATRPAGTKYVQVASGNLFACATLDDDSLRCWGSDTTSVSGPAGQLGNDTAGSSSSPTAVISRFSITITGTGVGDVTSTAPLSLSCLAPSTSCAITRSATLATTTTDFVGTPAVGSDPVVWSGACLGTAAGQTCTRGLSWTRDVSATFNLTGSPARTLTVTKSGTGTVATNDLAINCGSTCSANFTDGTTVTLKATPAAGFTLVNPAWTGCTSAVGDTCTIVMTADATVSVTFTPLVTLTITKSGTGSGTVTSVPAGISCGTTCVAQYAQGTSVTLTAAAATGSSFSGWTGCTSATNSCTLTLSNSTTVNAAFVSGSILTVTATNEGTGSGSITSSPAGISACTATTGTCTAVFSANATVTLTATLAAGSIVTWTGCASTTATTCTVVMSVAKGVGATFALGRTLAVSKTGSGTVTSNPAKITCGTACTASFPDGATVVLTATPAVGYIIGAWGGDCAALPAGSTTCTLSMTANRTASVAFLASTTRYALTVTRNLVGGGNGSVTSSPSGISCGSTCSATYLTQTTVTLTASAASGSVFTGWSGACVNATGTCIVVMTEARNVTATFSTSRTLSVSKVYGSYGTVTSSPVGISCGSTCSRAFPYGTTVTLTAVANTGRRFVGWSGGGCSGTGTCVVTLTANTSVTATFGLA